MRRWLPYAVVPVTFAAGLWQKWPCHSAGWPYNRALIFGKLCYSDLPVLYADRGLAEGHFPYATERSFEYPVILGYLADLTARLASSAQSYFLLNLLVLLACTLVTVWATIALVDGHGALPWRLRGVGGRPGEVLGRGGWAGLLVAASLVLALTGTINWDMVPVMFVSLAMLAWARHRPHLAGLAIGLGTATKLYPALLLFALLVLTFSTRRWRPFLQAAAAAAGAWVAVNLPVMVLFPHGWAVFWELNSQREADFGSVFYALGLIGSATPAALNAVSIVLFGLSLAGIGFFAPRRLEVLVLLTIAAFLITNKVYSPQYVLWLLPLAVVAGASLPVIAAWQLAETAYWWAVWKHLLMAIPDRLYAAVVFVRIAAELLLCVAVLANRKLVPDQPIVGDEHPARAQEVDGDVAVARGA
ncbi:membrane protein [Rhizocola hellebori]|uniref:Membrane protein n=1 Tax=Rhizocola hellebori TaxID=1392758 RepID=A0A8J3QE60_9ACTN|nr:glycosyltransferase 87 family protein [Rhizocola hellebori]GIH09076.1 membrane protein [Rhizocola hellebori]